MEQATSKFKSVKMTEDQIDIVSFAMLMKDIKITEVNKGDIELSREIFAKKFNDILNLHVKSGIKISDLLALEDVLQQLISRLSCIKIAQTISSLSELNIIPKDLSAIEFVAEKTIDIKLQQTRDYQMLSIRALTKEIIEEHDKFKTCD